VFGVSHLILGASNIRGVLLRDNETAASVVSFRGLRYAEPPIGDLRYVFVAIYSIERYG